MPKSSTQTSGSTAAATIPLEKRTDATSPTSEDFARIDAVDRIRSAVRTSRLEKTLQEQRSGGKNDPVSRWHRAGFMAEQLGKQDSAPAPAVKGKAASPPRRPNNSTSPTASPPIHVDSLAQQLLSSSFFDKLPFTFCDEAEKEQFINESKVLTKRMEDQNWLEMLDPKHRYGSNLKHYHRYWNLKVDTRQNFLQWLDEGEGRDLSLEECSRSKLEGERISYLTADQRRNYMTYIDNEAHAPPQQTLREVRAQLKSHPGKGRLRWCRTGELVNTSKYDHGDLGKGRGIALRQSKEWQDAIATGKVCEVVRDDKIKFRRTNSTESSDSFISDSSFSDTDSPEDDMPHQPRTREQPSPSGPHPVVNSDEKQQSRKEKLFEKANLGPKYLVKRKLGLYPTADRQQVFKGDADDAPKAEEEQSRPDALIRRRKTDTWIFVTDLSYNMYIGIKQRGRFQHSSLLAGSLVTVAGVLKVKDMVSLYPSILGVDTTALLHNILKSSFEDYNSAALTLARSM